MSEVLFSELTPFLEAIAGVGIEQVVLRRTEERRPPPGEALVPVEPYRRVDLLAYQEATLFKCVLDGARATELAAPLSLAGLRVRIVSGNLT